MKKRIGILCAMIILIGIPCVVKAAESSGSDDAVLKSYGNIFYEDATGSVRIYAEDIALLQEKLASIPDEIFDPVLYSHTHVWEYIDITEQGHTKHCEGCGSKFDLVNQHSVAETKECTISYNGRDYPGYENICECGYTWKEEAGHILIYTQKDEIYHAVSCELAGTSYCPGMEYDEMSHGITLCPIDDSRHQAVCGDCGYKGDISECVFDILGDATDNSAATRYCKCGNSITETQHESENIEETEETEKNTVMPEVDKIPEISVSGNDLTEKVTENDLDQKGENGL